MFTGLVEGMGQIVELIDESPGVRLRIRPSAEISDAASSAVRNGDSVAINGCCLTVVETLGELWGFQAGTETLSRTNLGRLSVGARVNLERSLRLGDQLGGHIVQGHIDGTGEVSRIEPERDWTTLWILAPRNLTRQMVSKGSVAVDGVSLTLVEVHETEFSLALIPHTLQATTLGERRAGDIVNIETDVLGKYVEKLLADRS